jgi:TolB-like protein
MSESRKAVFISHASQDAESATRLAEALRAAGIEAWLDTSELRGGDAWDASIRRQIRDCHLFIPIVSAETESRGEGYFRLEWKLAVDRSRLIADDQAFIVPVAIDATSEATARVPDEFRDRQWIRLPGGNPDTDFAPRIADLLARGAAARPAPPRAALARHRSPRWIPAAIASLVLFAVALLVFSVIDLRGRDRPREAVATGAISAQNSIAVLAFRNLSDDKQNEYFSDGVSEELLTTLQKVPGLQVAARSSSFSFKGTNATAQEIGGKLGVAHLVEGSVRKAGNSVRITAQLTRAATGQQLWSDAYTREASDVLAVQNELAQAIVAEMRGFLGTPLTSTDRAEIRTQVEEAAKGGTKNPEAHEHYLQGVFLLHQAAPESLPRAIELLDRAVAADPSFAVAWAALSEAGFLRSGYGSTVAEYEEGLRIARRAADRAIAVGPTLPMGYVAKANLQLMADFDWKAAADSFRRARSLGPPDVQALTVGSRLAYALGQKEKAVQLAQEGLRIDPLNTRMRAGLAFGLESLGRYEDAQAQFERITELSPKSPYAHAGVALMLMRRERLDEAEREVARAAVDWERLTVQAQVLWAAGKKAEADAALKQLIDKLGNVAAYQVAQVYAHRRDNDRAFEWLRRAVKQRDSGITLCGSDRTLETLYPDPRWPAFLKELGVANPPAM